MSGPLFEWRAKVQSTQGPKSPTTRFVLLNLSFRMDTNTLECWPSIDLQSRETGLCEKTIRTHLEIAEAEGWIVRWKEECGQKWRLWHYRGRIPDGKRGATVTARSSGQSYRTSAEPAVRHSETCGKTFQDVRYDLPTNSSENSLENSSEGDRGQQDAPAPPDCVPKGWEKKLRAVLSLPDSPRGDNQATRIANAYRCAGGDVEDLDRLLDYGRIARRLGSA